MGAKHATVALSIILSAGGLTVQTSAAQDKKNDCNNPINQLEVRTCVSKDFETADAELNKAYAKARDVMREADKQFSKEMQGGEKALLNGQRGWIAYRDGQCEAAAFAMHGGNGEPIVYDSCQTSLTRARTKELLELVEGFL